MTVAKKPGRRGEREISRNTTAQGRPVDPVVLPPCFFCTGPTGAIGTRLSLRPLDFQGAIAGTTRAYRAARIRTHECHRHCERSEAIHATTTHEAGLLRRVAPRNDAYRRRAKSASPHTASTR